MKKKSHRKLSIIIVLFIIAFWSFSLQGFISPGVISASVQTETDPTPTAYPADELIPPQDHAPGIIIGGIGILVIILGGFLLRRGKKIEPAEEISNQNDSSPEQF